MTVAEPDGRPGAVTGDRTASWRAGMGRPRAGWCADPVERADRDRGSGTVLVLALVASALVLAGLLGLLASAQGARGRAQTAADLAALAGAHRALTGADGACAVAGQVAARNGARLDACRQAPGAVVEVVAGVPGVWGTATAAARAGPRSAT